MSKPKYINYSLSFSNSSDTVKVCQFSLDKILPIIGNPEEYIFYIQRLTVSTRETPRLYNYILPFGSANLTGDVNKTLYTVYLVYNNITYRTVVLHVPEGNFTPPPPLTAQSPFQDLTSPNSVKYYAISSIQHWLNLLNTAFQTSMTALLADHPSLTPTTAPYFQLDNTTGLITLYGSSLFSPSAPSPIKASVNFRTRAILKNFPYYDENDGIYTFVFSDITGPPAQTISQQETVQLDSFSSAMVELVVKSDSIPVNRTYIDLPLDVGETTTNNNALNLVNTEGYINSFSVLENASSNLNRIAVSYVPQGQWRKMSLISPTPLQRINIGVFYKDAYQNQYPLLLSPSDYVSILMTFERKDSLTDDYK